jgi:ribonuclease HI
MINTDGAFKVESLSGATGAMIRDEHGSFLKASARQIPLAGSTLMVEAEALRDGILLLGPLPQQKVILETDSLELANIWRGRENHRSEIQLSKWFYDTSTGAATGAARCSSFMRNVFSLLVVGYG